MIISYEPWFGTPGGIMRIDRGYFILLFFFLFTIKCVLASEPYVSSVYPRWQPYGFGKVSLYYLEERLLKNNPLIKEKETEIEILKRSLENFDGENSGTFTVGFEYYPSSYYAEKIMGYTYGVSGRFRYPILGEYGDVQYKKYQLKALIDVKNAELQQLKNSLLFKLRSAYVDYYYSFLVENKIKDAIIKLQDIKARLKQRYIKKYSLWTDVLTVDTLITKLRASLASIYEERLKSLANIRSLVSDPYLPEFSPQLSHGTELTHLYLPPSNELIEFAKEHRKDIEFLKKAYSLLSKAAENYGDTYPKAWVNLIGSVTSYEMDRVDSGVGVTLDFTFPWKKRQAERALKKERFLRAKRASIRVSLLTAELITAVQNAVSNFQIYKSKYLAYRREYLTAEQSRKVFERRFASGLYGGGDGLMKLASLVNQEVGSYQLMMLSFKNMLTQYFSLLNAMGVRELPWIVRTATVEPSLTFSEPVGREVFSSTGLLLFSYVWDTKDLLSNPAVQSRFVETCKSLGLTGVYISLDGDQIRYFLGTFNGNQQLIKFLSFLKSQGLTVQLLLGENTWVYPENREKLLDIVKLFNRFNLIAGNSGFDGLHLDIEPHSLSDWKYQREKLELLYIETLNEVKELSNKPVVVDLSPVYLKVPFQGTTLAEKVIQVVDGVNVMAYSTNFSYIKKVAHSFSKLGLNYGRPVTITFSVEKDLSDLETFYRKPISELLEAMNIVKESGISSVAFQDFSSLVDYASKVSPSSIRRLVNLPKGENQVSIPPVGKPTYKLIFNSSSTIPKEIVLR